MSWEDQTLHVVALGIDPCEPALVEGLTAVRAGRDARARRIGEALEAAGIPGAYRGRPRLRHERAPDLAHAFRALSWSRAATRTT